jgi:hypothetical protein
MSSIEPDVPHPLIEQLTGRLAEVRAGDVPALDGLFDELATRYVPWRMNALLRQLATDPDQLLRCGSSKFLLLGSGDGYSIGLSIIDRRPRHLHWHPSHIWYRGLGTHGGTMSRYRLPDGTSNSVVNPAVRLDLVESRAFGPGDIMVRDGGRDIIDLDFEENRGLVLLRLQLRLLGDLEWMFDRTSLTAVGASTLNPTSSQLTSLAHAASLIGDKSSVEPLEAILAHPSHAVRWGAVQAIGRLDRGAALSALRRLSDDPHPHVRASAVRALQKAEAAAASAMVN